MASSVKIPKLNIGVGNRIPLFIGSGLVEVDSSMTNEDIEFQTILRSPAISTQLTGPSDTYTPINWGQTKDSTFYSTPSPQISLPDCITAIQHIKNIPYPTYLEIKTLQRDIILNYDFSNYTICSEDLKLLKEYYHLFFAIEFNINEYPTAKTINTINSEIKQIRKEVSGTATWPQIWLKIAHPTDIRIDHKHLNQLTAPQALVIAHGIPGAFPKVEQFRPSKPTLHTGSHLYSRSLATLLTVKDEMRIPLIIGGGINEEKQIVELLNNGASGVQVTSTLIRVPRKIYTLIRRLTKTLK